MIEFISFVPLLAACGIFLVILGIYDQKKSSE